MCGIAGILDFNGLAVPVGALEGMAQALAHRGPNGQGFQSFGQVGLAHRRLSIIDLAGGAQPMANEDGSIWVSFNGEIYNHAQLRATLESLGHRFATRSDTEVIVHGYEEWGQEVVTRLRGMFAFGVADLAGRRLFLARDHLGIKPLVYFQAAGVFAFASELRALKTLAEFPSELDLEALDQYLYLQYIPAPATIFKGVRKLPPAHCLTVPFSGLAGQAHRYWKFGFDSDPSLEHGQWMEALEAALEDSVRAHLEADVEFGAFLSGGVDSSAVLAFMSKVLDRPVKAFSIAFDDPDYDESFFARQAAAHMGAQHHVELVRPDALEVLPGLVSHYGEPFGDSSAVPTWYLSRMAGREVRMVLSGDGGDEIFAGYDAYAVWLRWMEENSQPPDPRLSDWLARINYVSVSFRHKLWRPEFHRLIQPDPPGMLARWRETAALAPCQRAQDFDLSYYLPSDILTKVDIASMAHGLEVRTPLTDVRVHELAARIPWERNMRRTAEGNWQGKLLFKKVVEKYYPAEFVHRPKKGFAVPLVKWLAPGGELRGHVQERFADPASPLLEYFEPRALMRLLEAQAIGAIWVLTFLDEWLRQHLGASKQGEESWTGAS